MSNLFHSLFRMAGTVVRYGIFIPGAVATAFSLFILAIGLFGTLSGQFIPFVPITLLGILFTAAALAWNGSAWMAVRDR